MFSCKFSSVYASAPGIVKESQTIILLSLMKTMHNPSHGNEADCRSSREREAFDVSRCFDCLPEDEWRPDGR